MITTIYSCDRCGQPAERLWSVQFVSDVGEPSGAKDLCGECYDEFRNVFLLSHAGGVTAAKVGA